MPQDSPSEAVSAPVKAPVVKQEPSTEFPSISGPDGVPVKGTGWSMVSESFSGLLSLVENTEHLTNFWKANQNTLDQLKTASPKLYEETISSFSKRKTELKGEAA